LQQILVHHPFRLLRDPIFTSLAPFRHRVSLVRDVAGVCGSASSGVQLRHVVVRDRGALLELTHSKPYDTRPVQ
jgi:hypothetical protein